MKRAIVTALLIAFSAAALAYNDDLYSKGMYAYEKDLRGQRLTAHEDAATHYVMGYWHGLAGNGRVCLAGKSAIDVARAIIRLRDSGDGTVWPPEQWTEQALAFLWLEALYPCETSPYHPTQMRKACTERADGFKDKITDRSAWIQACVKGGKP